VSQVRANFRNAVTIPEQSWGRFRDIISEFIKHQETAGPGGEAAAALATGGGGGGGAVGEVGVVASSKESGDTN